MKIFQKQEPYHPVVNSYQDVLWLRRNYAPARVYWQAIRTAVCEREKGLCQVCKNPGGEVHHVRYMNVLHFEHLYVKDRKTLQWLCHSCHMQAEANKRKKYGSGKGIYK